MLALKEISKSFSTVKALNKVSMEFIKGEVHAICGENGAGKTTVTNIITGNIQPDEGQMFWNGEAITIKNVPASQKFGIGIVYQERSLANHLSVGENIFFNKQPKNKLGLIDFNSLFKQTNQMLNHLQIKNISPDSLVEHLSAGQKQMVEIAKAVNQKPQLLILDEPTASISEGDSKTLFNIINMLKSQGVAIIYISHRMAEIKIISDKISILKDGAYQGTFETDKINIEEIINKMVGRVLQKNSFQTHSTKELLLEVKNISGSKFSGINFKIHKGEILGMAGLVGAGRTEIAKAIIGAEKLDSGEILIKGKGANIQNPSDAINRKISYLPEERKALGSFQSMNIEENIISSSFKKVSKKGWLDFQELKEISNSFIQQLSIKTPSSKQIISKLSGGNQQKVVLAKCLFTNPEILIVDEPTHGIDIGAKMEIYLILKELSVKGIGIILISSELPELLFLADNIMVMHEGKQTALLNKLEATEELIMAYASGEHRKL